MVADHCQLIDNSPLQATIRSDGQLIDPGPRGGETVVGRFAQLTSLIRGRRLLEIEIHLELERPLIGDPWEDYAAVRWAWRDAGAELWRSVHLGRQQAERDRFAGPLFCEIRQDSSPLTILPGGLPWHRRTADRQLDTLVLLPGERSRNHRLALGVGVEYPVREAIGWMQPPVTVELPAVIEPNRGWLFHLDAKNIVAMDWEVSLDEAGPAGVRVQLQETEGRYGATQLRSARPVVAARRLALSGDVQRQLTVQDDSVELHLAPLDWIVVELWWRTPPE
jgi:hypothetical protein